MGSHVDSGSVADKKAASQGRKFKGKIYDTVAQKLAAQKAASSYSGQVRSVVVPGGGPVVKKDSGGWKVKPVSIRLLQFTASMTGALETKSVRLLGGSTVGIETDYSQLAEVEITGIRLEVNVPLTITRMMAAFAIVTNDAAADKAVLDVAKVPGAVKLSSVDIIDGWYTVPLTGVNRIRTLGQSPDPKLLMYCSTQCVGSGYLDVNVHVTYKSPEGAKTHTL